MSHAVIARRQMLTGVAAGTLASVAALATTRTTAKASAEEADSVLGAWHVTVSVDGVLTTFDALYGFAQGGVFTRIDGRSNTLSSTLANAPAMGTWKRDEDGVVVTFVLFAYNQLGQRIGTITTHSRAQVGDNGVMSGPFTATAALPHFPKTGTFTATRIEPRYP